jgi:hypothetical protein
VTTTSTRAADGPRLSFEPLERTLAAFLGHIETGTGCTGPNRTRIAFALGVQARQLYRLRDRGLTWSQADTLAIHAGYHPAEIWSEWWSLIEEDACL